MFSESCKRCGYENPIAETKCRRCATILSEGTEEGYALRPTSAIDKPLTVGIIGSAILFVGVFTPIVSLPIVGSMNYFQSGSGDGVIVLALSLISVVLIMARKYRGLLITGGLSLALLVFTFVNFQLKISQAKASMNDGLKGNLFDGLGQALLGTIQLQWGWAVLVIGAITVISAGLLKAEERKFSIGVTGAIANFLSDTRILAASIGLIVILTAAVVAMNFLATSGTIQRASNVVSEAVFPDKSVSAMEETLRVDFIGKEFEKADYQSGQYMDSVTVKLNFSNLGTKDISGFKGIVEFKDMFDDPIKSVNLSHDEKIPAGKTKNWTGSINYNQFIAADSKFRDVSIEKLKFRFNPIAIHFSDGTKLEKTSK